jgi:hypothetical protein
MTLHIGETSQIDNIPSKEAQARRDASSFANVRLDIASLC